jgi:hypothetical protein
VSGESYLAEVSGAFNAMYAKALALRREQGPAALDDYADQAGHELRAALTEIEPPPEWTTLHAELLACSFPEGDAFPRTRDAEIALSRRMQRVSAELNAACLADGVPPPFPDELSGGTTLELDGGLG